MANKHTAVLPDGSIAKRVSQNRVYSHCIAGRPIYTVALGSATHETHNISARNTHAHYARVAKLNVGDRKYINPPSSILVGPLDISQAVAFLRQFPTAEDYAAHLRAARVKRVEDAKTDGYFDKWEALGWSSRRDLAEKAAGQWPSYEKQIIEARVS